MRSIRATGKKKEKKNRSAAIKARGRIKSSESWIWGQEWLGWQTVLLFSGFLQRRSTHQISVGMSNLSLFVRTFDRKTHSKLCIISTLSRSHVNSVNSVNSCVSCLSLPCLCGLYINVTAEDEVLASALAYSLTENTFFFCPIFTLPHCSIFRQV